MEASPNSVWKVSDSVRSTYTQDGAVVLDIQKGMYYSLNAVAATAWKMLESRRAGSTLQDLIASLKTYFEVAQEDLDVDMAEHLKRLEKAGLVRQCS